MATEEDLINAVRDSLEREGEFGKMKADMRTKVMKIFDSSSSASNHHKKPESPKEVIIINELIREYFDWIGYKYSLNILKSECDFGKHQLERSFILQDLGVKETEKTKQLPLLFSLIETFKSQKTQSQD